MEKFRLNNVLMRKIYVAFWAIIGILITIKLAIIYFQANYNPYALPSFCSVNNFIDCDGVARTIHSQFLGIPLAYWGMFLYLFMIFLLFTEKLKQIKFMGFLEVFKHPLAYISALGFISFAISMILAGISIFEIKKICVLCVCTYLINLLIAILANENGFVETFKVSFQDFIDAIKVKKYLISFIAVSILAGGFLAFTGLTYFFVPQIRIAKEFEKYRKMQSDNPFSISGNLLGEKNAKLVVYIYTDYRCPICRTFNVMINRAGLELGGLKIIHKNLPLDVECNKMLKEQFHVGSCMLSRYSIAAENQGRFWDLNTEIFKKLPKDEDELLNIAGKMGFDTKKLKADANSPETKQRLESDIDSAIKLNLDGTPTVVINGKVYPGIKPYYELKALLIKAGAFEK